MNEFIVLSLRSSLNLFVFDISIFLQWFDWFV